MPATRLRIFISSVQKEFAQIRRDLKAFLLGDAVLRRFVAEVFLFEEIPAKDRRADQVYLEEVERCDIYLGIFGYDYGFEDESGVSPTEHEYNHATRHGKTRLVYVWGSDDKKRAPKMRQLVSKAMIELCREAGLPESDFELRAGSFVITLWRDWLTAEVLARLDLNERQRQAIAFVKAQGQITNRNLREQSGVTIRTASRDLEDLVRRGVLTKVGATGRSTFYVMARKLDTNRTNRT